MSRMVERIDGAQNNLPSYCAAGHFEVAPCVILDEHIRIPEMLIMSTVGVPLLNQAIRRFLSFFFTETDFPGIIQAERDFPQHSSRFDLNEKTLWSGVAVMTQFAFDWQDA